MTPKERAIHAFSLRLFREHWSELSVNDKSAIIGSIVVASEIIRGYTGPQIKSRLVSERGCCGMGVLGKALGLKTYHPSGEEDRLAFKTPAGHRATARFILASLDVPIHLSSKFISWNDEQSLSFREIGDQLYMIAQDLTKNSENLDESIWFRMDNQHSAT